MKNQSQYASFISFIANGVNKICFEFNKQSVFKFEAEINSMCFRLRVDNFKKSVFLETITNNFSDLNQYQGFYKNYKNFLFLAPL